VLDVNAKCCASGQIDNCGVCDGNDSSCSASVDIEVWFANDTEAQQEAAAMRDSFSMRDAVRDIISSITGMELMADMWSIKSIYLVEPDRTYGTVRC
jgi:hypothetical protein